MRSLERWNYLHSLVVASLMSIYCAKVANYDEVHAKCATDIEVARLDQLAREHVAMTLPLFSPSMDYSPKRCAPTSTTMRDPSSPFVACQSSSLSPSGEFA
jgi:hypothetical protein